MSTKKFKDFNDWCMNLEPDNTKQNLAVSQQVGNHPDPQKFEEFVAGVKFQLQHNNVSSFNINSELQTGEYVVDFSDAGNNYLDSINIGHGNVPVYELTIKGVRARSVVLNYAGGQTKYAEPLIFDSCDIANLILHKYSRITLRNCNVGNLIINNAHQIHMNGGCVLNIEVAAPGNGVPLTGSVNFSSTFFPRNRDDYLLPGAQPYRNMRHHLSAIENGYMSNLFYSLELAVERGDDSFVNRMLSHAYELFSGFGRSASRPVIWWFSLLLISAVVIYVNHGAVAALPKNDYLGWRSVFISHHSVYADVIRSAYLSFRSMMNPLGLFGVRELVIPTRGWLMSFLSMTGLLSAVLIALFILAVRRRFKMQL